MNKQALQKFKEIWKKRFGDKLTDEEAYFRANNLLNLYKTIYVHPKNSTTILEACDDKSS